MPASYTRPQMAQAAGGVAGNRHTRTRAPAVPSATRPHSRGAWVARQRLGAQDQERGGGEQGLECVMIRLGRKALRVRAHGGTSDTTPVSACARPPPPLVLSPVASRRQGPWRAPAEPSLPTTAEAVAHGITAAVPPPPPPQAPSQQAGRQKGTTGQQAGATEGRVRRTSYQQGCCCSPRSSRSRGIRPYGEAPSAVRHRQPAALFNAEVTAGGRASASGQPACHQTAAAAAEAAAAAASAVATGRQPPRCRAPHRSSFLPTRVHWLSPPRGRRAATAVWLVDHPPAPPLTGGAAIGHS